MSNLELVRFVRECYPEYNGQLLLNLTDCANLFGLNCDQMRAHLRQYGIPHYLINGKSKRYCVPEVMESIMLTRNKQGKR